AAMLCVRDLGVKLQAIDGTRAMPDGGEGARVGRGQRLEVLAQIVDLVPVAHPDGDLVGQSGKEPVVLANAAGRPAELARRSGRHLASLKPTGRVHSVTDAQDGDPQVKNGRVGF